MASKLSNVLHKEYNTILESTEFYDTEILIGEYPYTETFKDITTKFSQFKELSRFYKKAIRRDPSLIFKANRLMEWCIAQSSELLLSDASNWTPSEIEIIGKFRVKQFSLDSNTSLDDRTLISFSYS
ncbi:11535_t:CDS:2, partial [Rhizophagus irregularis]